MFRILTPDGFVTSPWKNGGGVTHEIARADVAGAWLWRLSIAEVASDGPFSRFEGLSRVLTVIEGAGMDLVTPEATLWAAPFVPVAFSGDTPVEGRLRDGPIRDFNLIHDARRISASVAVINGPHAGQAGAGTTAVLHLAGSVQADNTTLPQGAVALGGIEGFVLGPDARALIVRLGEVG